MKNTITTIIGLAIIPALIFIAYQAFVAIPREKIEAQQQQAAAAIEAKRQDEERKLEKYDQCIQTAWNNYSANWDQMCEIQKLEKDCTLGGYLSDGLDQRHEEAKDRCVALYK